MSDTTLNKTLLRREKRCRECVGGGDGGAWSDLTRCQVLRCDRDELGGNPLLRIVEPEIAPVKQTLFAPDRVVAVYPGKKCRECLSDGEWSPEGTSCLQKRITTPKPPPTCSLDDLIRVEYLHFNYVRIRIESPDGQYKIST